MAKQNTNHSAKGRFWKFGLIFLAVFFIFFTDNKASADVVACTDPSARFRCDALATTSDHVCTQTPGECQFWCAQTPGYGTHPNPSCTETAYDPGTGTTDLNNSKTTLRKPLDNDPLLLPFKWLIYGVFKFCVWMLGLAGIIFDFIINPNNISFIMNNQGLYASWAMVRDFLNLGFILVLLYIAFCVIFQITSYSDSWKKMLLMMVIMALLVNFSFPICRLIIDISNITFYYILNTGFPGAQDTGSSIVTNLINTTQLGSILDVENISVTGLVAMTVFTFIAAITFLVIAILFVVRMVAIGLLIIFSPVGFAGVAFPFSKKYATRWWTELFNYAFFAPIMIFMIVIARNIMSFTNTAGMLEAARKNLGAGEDPNVFGNMAFFAIPIVILWIGMGMARSMGIMGAGAVTGGAERFAKWAGKNAGGLRPGARWLSKASGLTGAVEARKAQFLNDRNLAAQQRQAAIAKAIGVRGADASYQQALAKRVEEEAKLHNTSNMASHDLEELRRTGDQFQKAAAIQELANRSQATQSDLDIMRTTFGETSQVFRQLQAKVKTYDPMAAFAHLADPQRQANVIDFMNSNQFDAKKIGTHSLGNKEFMELAISSGAIANKDIMELKKDSSKNGAMKKSLGAIIAEGHRNAAASEEDRNIHMANFALTGEIVDANFAKHIAQNLDKDNAANMTDDALKKIDVNNIKQGKLAEVIGGIKNNDVARGLFTNLKASTSTHSTYISNHPTLKKYA